MTDVFLPKRPKGIVYGLFASDEPLQIRYVGQTQSPAIVRLKAHLTSYNSNKPLKNWMQNVKERGAQVGMRTLGEYPIKQLETNEQKWIRFWLNYSDLFNVAGVLD